MTFHERLAAEKATEAREHEYVLSFYIDGTWWTETVWAEGATAAIADNLNNGLAASGVVDRTIMARWRAGQRPSRATGLMARMGLDQYGNAHGWGDDVDDWTPRFVAKVMR